MSHRQNLWNLKASYGGRLDNNSDFDNFDALLYIASAEGFDNVVAGYEKNAKPIVDAINELNKYFEFNISHDSFDRSRFEMMCEAVCGRFEATPQADDQVKIRIYKETEYQEYDYSAIITAEEYAELEGKLQAVPNAMRQIYNNCSEYSSYPFYTITDLIGEISFRNDELATRDAILKLLTSGIGWSSNCSWEEYWENSWRDSFSEVANYTLIDFMLYFMMPLIGIIIFLILWIFAIKMLIVTNKYTHRVLHEYYAEYLEQKRQYDEQRKAYKAYRKAHFDYLIARGYFEEGVPHIAKDKSVT